MSEKTKEKFSVGDRIKWKRDRSLIMEIVEVQRDHYLYHYTEAPDSYYTASTFYFEYHAIKLISASKIWSELNEKS
jgi:hypothetical protein